MTRIVANVTIPRAIMLHRNEEDNARKFQSVNRAVENSAHKAANLPSSHFLVRNSRGFATAGLPKLQRESGTPTAEKLWPRCCGSAGKVARERERETDCNKVERN